MATVWALFLLCQCKNETSKEYLQLFGKQKITLLDSAHAAIAINTDRVEHFFEKITPLDMSLQMKQTFPVGTPRAAILQQYQQFLSEEVMPFSEADEALLMRVFEDIKKWCDQISPDLFPKGIQLIKTRGRHYGDGTYYTREKNIIIPADVLQSPNERTIREVLIHEVFHVYARLHPEKRAALYQLIGFRPLNGELELPSGIAARRLLNPDGINIAYAIQLAQAPGDTLSAVPIITSNAPVYLPERQAYFEYIDFNLYPVDKQIDGHYLVITTPEGISPLRVNEQGDFFKQITDNTMYIIHPDEILADDFKYLVLAQSGEEAYQLTRFSQEGQALLKEIEVVLKE